MQRRGRGPARTACHVMSSCLVAVAVAVAICSSTQVPNGPGGGVEDPREQKSTVGLAAQPSPASPASPARNCRCAKSLRWRTGPSFFETTRHAATVLLCPVRPARPARPVRSSLCRPMFQSFKLKKEGGKPERRVRVQGPAARCCSRELRGISVLL